MGGNITNIDIFTGAGSVGFYVHMPWIKKTLTMEAPGYINHITLCEITWVLQRCYGVTKPQLKKIIEGLLTTK